MASEDETESNFCAVPHNGSDDEAEDPSVLKHTEQLLEVWRTVSSGFRKIDSILKRFQTKFEVAPPPPRKRKADGEGKSAAKRAKTEGEDGEGKKKRRKKKDPNRPKGARSAYMFFVQDNRDRIQKEHSTATFKEMGVLMGAAWKEISDPERRKYEKRAEADRIRATEEKRDYVPPSN
eukprot:gnl/Hemi2/7531_TR2577_c0_g13_i1.p1 gnl/Hemi2/7531_TR2577_c0_g13~~gnl/Hemi2/7531_TR2577_c0_g13_i1.p1  ORF type:complete len:198 (-),score=67.18 gnl/Hemi2/7531_TR2577_c0_g13_i1:117-650(-)